MLKRILCLSCLAISFTSLFAEVFKTDEKGFVRDWLLGGPYPSYWIDAKPKGFSEDFLGKIGGEANALPSEGMKEDVEFIADTAKLIAGIGSTNEWGYTETKIFPVEWKALHSGKPVVTLDNAFLPLKDHIVSYAHCYIVSPERRKIKLRVGSDDDHKIFLNGRLAGSFSGSQGVAPDNFIYDAELQRGLNSFLVKVVNRTHGYGFCLALSDANDNPLSGLDVLLDHPARILMAGNPVLLGVDMWDAGYYACLKFPGDAVFSGRGVIRVQCGTPVDGDFKFALKLEVNGKSVIKEERVSSLAAGKLLDFTLNPLLPAGKALASIAVYRNGEPVAELAKAFEVLDPEKVKAETSALRREMELVAANLAKAKSEGPALEIKLKELEARHEKLYSKIEEAYLTRRSKLVSSPKPVDEPLQPISIARSRLCLNGDQWLIGAPGKDGARPPQGKMLDIRVPVGGMDSFFRRWQYPVALENPKNQYGNLKEIRGWEGYKFNNMLCKKAVWLKREIDWDPMSPASPGAFFLKAARQGI